MSVLAKINEYLGKIKAGELNFQTLINKGFKDVPENEAFLIRDSLKSIVNRYYFLLWEQAHIFPIENETLRDYFICALGQYHYVKGVTEDLLLEYFNQDVRLIDEKASPSDMIGAIRNLGGSPYPLSEKDNEILARRLSINYAYPEWMIKMMIKHYGIKHIYKSVAASRKSISLVVNTNAFLTTPNEVIANSNGGFAKGVLAQGALRYTGKEKIIDLPVFKKNQVFVEDELSQMLVEKLALETGDNALIYAEEKAIAAIDMAVQLRDVGTVYAACPRITDYNQVRSLAARFKFHSIQAVNSTMDVLLTHIEKESCDKVLLIPNSSSLGLVRRKPDVVLTLKREMLDTLIENEKHELEEASIFVKAGGTLIYSVFTYNKKESSMVVDEFLANHADFEKVEEKQIFAYEAPSDGAYYAILKRK